MSGTDNPGSTAERLGACTLAYDSVGERRSMSLEPAESILQLEPDDPAPAYVQLARRVRLAVANGTLQPGDRLPTVRRLADRLGLAANTVGRAYADLGREGVIVARAGGGSEVAPLEQLDRPALARFRQERLRTLGRQAAVRGLALGFEPAEIAGAVAAELAARGRPVPQAGPRRLSLGTDEEPLLSTRNRLQGTIASLRVGEMLAEVSIRLDDGSQVVAAITRTSLERLGLAEGAAVSAYVKATEIVLGP
jgi:molybdopterin-binding protein